MKIFFLVLITFLFGLTSCKTNHSLTKNDIAFNPYKLGDTLYFQSDKDERDTFIIYSIKKQTLRKKCYSFLNCISTYLFSDTWEGYFVNTNKPNESWANNNILTIRAELNGTKTFYFNLNVKNALWYSDSENDLIKISSIPITTIKGKDQIFTDVITIISKNEEYRGRNNFIEKIYWSKSYGFVGFDKLNGDKWMVTKKRKL